MTEKTLIVLLCLFICVTQVKAQKLQIGFNGTINRTFFHKGASIYDSHFETKSLFGVGFSIPVYYRLSERFSLKTGIGFQNKKYHFELNKFDFPGIVDNSGSFYFRIKFKSTEIPLAICFSQPFNNNYKIEYRLGCVFSLNAPNTLNVGYYTFTYNGNDSCSYKFNVTENWDKYFSPDLYVGIGFVNFKESLRRNQLSISYQYGFANSTEYNLFAEIINQSFRREYIAFIKPNLSCLALNYTFYPKWLNFLKD